MTEKGIFFSFFQSSPDLLFVFDMEGSIIEANRTAAEKLQYEPEELPGKSIYSLHPLNSEEMQRFIWRKSLHQKEAIAQFRLFQNQAICSM